MNRRRIWQELDRGGAIGRREHVHSAGPSTGGLDRSRLGVGACLLRRTRQLRNQSRHRVLRLGAHLFLLFFALRRRIWLRLRAEHLH